jgi:hypothetical protein
MFRYPQNPARGGQFTYNNELVVRTPAVMCQSIYGGEYEINMETAYAHIAAGMPNAPDYNDESTINVDSSNINKIYKNEGSCTLEYESTSGEKASVYALPEGSGVKRGALYFRPPGYFTGKLKSFMLAMYGSNNGLCNYSLSLSQTGIPNGASISLKNDIVEPQYNIGLDSTDGYTTTVSFREDEFGLEYYLIQIVAQGDTGENAKITITSRKMRFGDCGHELKEKIRTSTLPAGLDRKQAEVLMFADCRGFCPPKSAVTQRDYYTPKGTVLAYGWHATETTNQAAIVRLRQSDTYKNIFYSRYEYVKWTINEKDRISIDSYSFVNTNPNGAVLNLQGDIIWTPGTGVQVCKNTFWNDSKPNLAASSAYYLSYPVYIIARGDSFENVVYSSSYVSNGSENESPPGYLYGYFGSPRNGYRYWNPRGYEGTKWSTRYFMTGYKRGFSGNFGQLEGSFMEWEHEIQDGGTSGSEYLKSETRSATSPAVGEYDDPSSPLPSGNYYFFAKSKWKKATGISVISEKSGSVKTAMVIPIGDCDAYYTISRTYKSAQSGNKYTSEWNYESSHNPLQYRQLQEDEENKDRCNDAGLIPWTSPYKLRIVLAGSIPVPGQFVTPTGGLDIFQAGTFDINKLVFTGEVEPGSSVCKFTNELAFQYTNTRIDDVAPPKQTIKIGWTCRVREHSFAQGSTIQASEECQYSKYSDYINLPLILDPTAPGLWAISGLNSASVYMDVVSSWSASCLPYNFRALGAGLSQDYYPAVSTMRFVGMF